jgi:hypothetical protein
LSKKERRGEERRGEIDRDERSHEQLFKEREGKVVQFKIDAIGD